MLTDIRYAFRFLRLNPGFSLTAILTLALGIGATTAVYSVYDAVLLKPLPFDHPERVVAVRIRQADGGTGGIAGGTIAAVRNLPAVARAAVFIGSDHTLLDRSDPEIVHDRILGRLKAVPGVESVSAMSHIPLARVLADAASVVTEEGVAMGEGRSGLRRRILAPGALHTLGVPIVKGREFTTADRDDGPRVAIVNEALAQKLWPGRDPLGQGLSIDSAGEKQPYRVVGLAGNLRGSLIRAPQPEVYVSATQVVARELSVVVRSVLPTASVVAATRAAIQAEEPDQPVAGVATVNGLAHEATTYRRFNTAILTLFGLFAALLAAAGILAVVSYAVARRTREIGVRIALGAAPRRVVLLVMRDVTPAIAIGLAAGLLAIYNLSFLLARANLLYEVRQFDVPTYAAAVATATAVAGVAAWLPARRAARVDPVVALRNE
jgi:hypothetical protein